MDLRASSGKSTAERQPRLLQIQSAAPLGLYHQPSFRSGARHQNPTRRSSVSPPWLIGPSIALHRDRSHENWNANYPRRSLLSRRLENDGEKYCRILIAGGRSHSFFLLLLLPPESDRCFAVGEEMLEIIYIVLNWKWIVSAAVKS